MTELRSGDRSRERHLVGSADLDNLWNAKATRGHAEGMKATEGWKGVRNVRG